MRKRVDLRVELGQLLGRDLGRHLRRLGLDHQRRRLGGGQRERLGRRCQRRGLGGSASASRHGGSVGWGGVGVSVMGVPPRHEKYVPGGYPPYGRESPSRSDQIDQEDRQQGLGDRADREGEGDGAEAETAAEQQADRDDGDLQRGAHQPDREAGTPGQPGHQPVARAAAELGTDVERSGEAAQHDAADHQREPQGQRVGPVEQREGRVAGEADHQRVGDGADAGHLLERDPQDQHHEAHHHHGLPQRDRHVPDQAGVQHVPGRQTQVAAHHHRQASRRRARGRRRAGSSRRVRRPARSWAIGPRSLRPVGAIAVATGAGGVTRSRVATIGLLLHSQS